MPFMAQPFSMRSPFSRRPFARALARFVFCAIAALPASGQSLACSEFFLGNGMRVLLSPRPGCGAIHAAWFFDARTGLSAGQAPEATSLLLEAWSLQDGFANAPGHWAKAGPNGVGHGRDLPASELRAWCMAEFDRIDQVLEIQRFEIAKSNLAAQMEEPDPLAELFYLAINGSGARPTSQGGLDAVAGISLSDVHILAAELVTAERATIVLIGDVEETAAREALEYNFALLPSGPIARGPAAVQTLPYDRGGAIEERTESPADVSAEAPPQGLQRVEVSSSSKTEALVAWQIPPSMDDEAHSLPSLALFAEILTGSEDARLFAHLVAELGCSTDALALIETAGVDGAALFIIRADVADGHTLEEVEKAIEGAMQKIARDDFGYVEINRAANRMDAKHAKLLGDAAGLAQALVDAQGSMGDWRPALDKATFAARLEPDALTQLVKPIFASGPNFVVLANIDPLLSPRTPDHARLIALLGNLYEKRGGREANREMAIINSLRQFGQMPLNMRKQLLALLESEAAR
jgi:hypothetical protein